MRWEKGESPPDKDLLAGGIEFAFAGRPRFGPPDAHIPQEQWAQEFAKSEAEEKEWWQGPHVAAKLAVELPFWFMMEDCALSIQDLDTTLKVSVNNGIAEVSEGPFFFDSHKNVVSIGPIENLTNEFLASAVSNGMPITRHMKTVLLFDIEAMADCFVAFPDENAVEEHNPSVERRFNRVSRYLEALAFAHLPFVNKLISSYSSTSNDPFAFEVSAWDVPIWYALHGGRLVRVNLLPYRDNDIAPNVRQGDQLFGYAATTPDQVEAQLREEIAPGKLELMDARSLFFRGKFTDAIRTAVTAIEVALDAKLEELLQKKGFSEAQVAKYFAETKMSFYGKLSEFERRSGKRIPGPILSAIPYINGLRLRRELDWVRGLRHEVVHEGHRIHPFDLGTMQRAMETMTWLFEWLSWEDNHGPSSNRNYIFFSLLRGGQRYYPLEFTANAIRVMPQAEMLEIKTEDEAFAEQYGASLSSSASDLELFLRMSFVQLGIDCKDGPPAARAGEVLSERFTIRHGVHRAAVFTLECDELINRDMANELAAAVAAFRTRHGTAWSALCVIHHQRQLPEELREHEDAISSEIVGLFQSCGIAVIGALDLQVLVRGIVEYQWDAEIAAAQLFSAGRLGLTPPGFSALGSIRTYYSAKGVLSVQIDNDKSVRLGDKLALRIGRHFLEAEVTSMQVNRVDAAAVTGPEIVGISAARQWNGSPIGRRVFVKGQLKTECPIAIEGCYI